MISMFDKDLRKQMLSVSDPRVLETCKSYPTKVYESIPDFSRGYLSKQNPGYDFPAKTKDSNRNNYDIAA